MPSDSFSLDDLPKNDKESDASRKSRTSPRRKKTVDILPLPEIHKQWKEGLETLGTVYSFKCKECGEHILENAERHATAVTKLCRDNAKIREKVSAMLAGSAYAGLIFSTGALVIPVVVHHGLDTIPRINFGHSQHKKEKGKVVPIRSPQGGSAPSAESDGAASPTKKHVYQPSAADPNTCVVCTQPRNDHEEVLSGRS